MILNSIALLFFRKLIQLELRLNMSTLSETIFDFDKNSNIENWTIINDVVMGGKSSGSFKINKDFILMTNSISLRRLILITFTNCLP